MLHVHLYQFVRSHTPSISAWIESSYGSRPFLHLGDRLIRSSCGVQQGDPLGPLAFSLALQPITEQIKREAPTLAFSCWYLDDGVICGPPEALRQALDIIEKEGPPEV